jgi:nitrate reductase NapD
MNISGIIVQSRPEHAPAVRGRLLELPGVEVHALGEDGRMVVTIERDTDGEMADTYRQLTYVDGVLAAALVYHHFEPDTDEEVSS